MKEMKEIRPTDLKVEAAGLWLKRWFLLSAGTIDDFNVMTVGWGFLGGIWGKSFAQVMVRPSRHTFKYMEKYDTFTLSSFPGDYRDALMLLGTHSGRDGDKVADSGLTPVSSVIVEAPSFEEADLVLECRKVYWQDLDPAHFLDESIERHYAGKDYHRVYFGEILRAAISDSGV